MNDLQSNCLRGDYMRGIVDKTINEVHDDLVTVFGPYATDAYLTKDQQPYYTRDGLETIRSMKFDNELSMYILKILYQAVYEQGKAVGDGTTTLAVLYTNLYKTMRSKGCTISRNTWNTAVKMLNDKIKEQSHDLTEDDLLQMFFTCTQDTELSAKIFNKLRQPIMDHAYIMIEKSNIESDFEITTHNSPMIKATRQFSIRPIKEHEENCVILHCNGMLDIVHPEVILDLMCRVNTVTDGDKSCPVPKTVILLCNGTTDATRRTVKDVVKRLHGISAKTVDLNQYNNVAIYTLTEYRSFDNDQIEDLSTMITDEYGIGGMVNQLTFESLLYQALCNQDPNNGETDISDLKTYDCELRWIDKIRNSFDQENYPIDFDDVEGMRIHKTLGPVAMARYKELKKAVETEKSPVKKVGLSKRLRSMYGQFIEVAVGSKLIKDSQRKYELILDAVLSASEAYEKGVLHANSILIALRECLKLIESDPSGELSTAYGAIASALSATMTDILTNGWDLPEPFSYNDWLKDANLEQFDATRDRFDQILPKTTDFDVVSTATPVEYNDTTYVLTNRIVEPTSIITTMLENSTLIIELAQAKTFHLESFMQNYL